MPESVRYGRDKEHEEAIARAREEVRIEREDAKKTLENANGNLSDIDITPSPQAVPSSANPVAN